ncbi:MAG: tRNA (adenosine(37)-N6)-threonylcarbamoyltransferase complex dimerization subunit type 1 TsaB [Acetobacteraceae bacterium]
MPLLALHAALGVASAAIIDGRRVLALEADPAGAAQLAVLASRVLRVAGVVSGDLGGVAASVGPGSFTGIRTTLALAAGIGLAAGKPVIGVSVGEALAAILPPFAARTLWVVIRARRQRVFLERAGQVTSFELAAVPVPSGPVLLSGDAAMPVAERLARAGADAALATILTADAAAVGLAGAARLAGSLPPRRALPLYAEPPAVRLPTGLRPIPI